MRPYRIFALLSVALVLPAAAFAQTSLGNFTQESPFTITVKPQYPAPYGQASITLISTTLELANMTMTVSLGGKEIYAGAVQPVRIPLGGAGSAANVKVTVSGGGLRYTQSVFIQPQDVVLVAEPVSSAPPLYPGKPLVPVEGSVRVVAMANLRDARGKVLDPAALSYSWTVDNTQIANSSGIGRQALLVASPLQYRARSVSVIVSSQDGNLVGGADLSLAPESPTVLVYRNDPLLGIRFDRALSGSYDINSAETTLYAAPFSFPTTSRKPSLEWFLNGASAQTGNAITLRPTGKGEGSASLSLMASTGDTTKAMAELSLSFGSSSGFNFFGL